MATSEADSVFPLEVEDLICDDEDDESKISDYGKPSEKKDYSKKSQKKKLSTNDLSFSKNISKLYFENSHAGPNILSMAPYSGPCVSTHLQRQLYLPLLVTGNTKDKRIHYDRFSTEYQEINETLTEDSPNLKISYFLRFGILYVNALDNSIQQPLSIKDFSYLRSRGKKLKTAFYTCKGVTSPKKLVTNLIKMKYEKLATNTFSYDIQLKTGKPDQGKILHLQYNENLECVSAHFRFHYPINFDFIRDKTVSRCRSIDDSYLDIFDFRIQLTQCEFLQRTDPRVLSFLRDVPIDEVLSIDKATKFLQVAPILRNHVRYLKCNRSDNYRNVEEQVMISIGTYEEYQLNSFGVCEVSMKAENIMTIELLGDGTYSAEKLYNLGIWFSDLCQSSVDFTVNKKSKDENRKLFRWFCDVPAFSKKSRSIITEKNAYHLTTYKLGHQRQTYTKEDFNFVRNILHHQDLKEMFLLVTDKRDFVDKNEMEDAFETVRKRLAKSDVPGAERALRKLHQAFNEMCASFTG